MTEELTDFMAYRDRPLADPNEPITRREPSLLVGALIAAAMAALSIFGAGGFDDGFQWVPDGVAIAGPFAAALGIRHLVDSPAESRRKQRVAYDRGRRYERTADPSFGR